MEKKQQVASVLAICASIILAGLLIAYQPGVTKEISEWRFPSGIPPALGTTGFSASVGETPPIKTLSISGAGSISVKADQAVVTLGVYTENQYAGMAIDKNAELMSAVIKAIKALGLKDEDMYTSFYNVYPVYNWDAKMVVSYQVTNMIQVKIKDLTKVGPVIDAAAAAGANKVEGISFGITDETAAKMKLDAYVLAGKDAALKANTICTQLGIKIVGVQSVSESSYSPIIPWRSYDASGEKSSTPILQGNLSVTVTLNIVYLIDSA